MPSSQKFTLILQTHPEIYTICKLPPHAPLPIWLTTEGNSFFSLTKTNEELSIVCELAIVPEEMNDQKSWRMFKIKGQMDFDLTGILKQVLDPLAESNIGIFAVSTYDTDYILVQEKDFDKATEVLKNLFEVEVYSN